MWKEKLPAGFWDSGEAQFSAFRIISGWRWKNRREDDGVDGIFTTSSREIRSLNRFFTLENPHSQFHEKYLLTRLKIIKIEKRAEKESSFNISLLLPPTIDSMHSEANTVIRLARINERSQHRSQPYHHLGSVGRPTLLYNQATAEISGARVLEPRSARPDNDAPLKPFLLNPHSPIRSVSLSTPTDKKNGAAITLEIFPRFLPLQWPRKFFPSL